MGSALVSELTLRSHARDGWLRVADWRSRFSALAKPAALAAVAALLAAVEALRGLAGLVLISYGAWLAYHPAGFVVAGVLLLADRIMDERKESPR